MGIIGGYKKPLNSFCAAIADSYYQSDDIVTLEISTEIDITDDFSVGPGFYKSYSSNDIKDFSDIVAGVGISYEF